MPLDNRDADAQVADQERADPEGADLEGADLERADLARVRETLAALAHPRMAGTEGAADVERKLRDSFADLGYEGRDLEFSFSNWPGRFGLSLSGGVVALLGLLGGWLLYAGLPGAALAVAVPLLALAVAPLFLLDPALRRLPWGRIEATNILFQRPGVRPSWILMAHRDTKSQLVPTLGRTAAVGAGALGSVGLVALAILWIVGDPFRSPTLAVVVGLLVFVAGVVLALSWAGNDSPGALDNASGLAALLEVARLTREHGDAAFLLTDGEEMGLAGARAVAHELPPVQGVINVDGLDDGGHFHVMEGHGWRRKGTAPQLVAALLRAASALEMDVERRRLPRFLHVDHLPIAAVGIPAVTLVRGNWQSLMRVHRATDEAERMDASGAGEGATLLALAVRLLRAGEAGHLAGRQGPAS